MGIENGRSGRVIPRTRENYGAANRKPDSPQLEYEKLEDLKVFVPQGKNNISTSGLVETKPAVAKKGFVPTKGTRVVPLFRKPLTPLFNAPFGGGRPGGGGTSKEALQRAKKKLRRQGK